jgi:hypothetical protein
VWSDSVFRFLNANLCTAREPEEMIVDEPDGAVPPARRSCWHFSTSVARLDIVQQVFQRAAAVLVAKHHLTEHVAFHMLVDGAMTREESTVP